MYCREDARMNERFEAFEEAMSSMNEAKGRVVAMRAD